RPARRSCCGRLPRASRERGPVERVDPVRAAIERELPQRALASRTTHLAGERAVRGQLDDRGGEGGGITGWDEQARAAVLDDLGQAVDVRCTHRSAKLAGLEP